MIISFAHTTEALLKGKKTVTRREWSDNHAMKFKKDQIVGAWDRLPRVKGAKIVAKIRLTCDPYKEKLRDMPVSDVSAEGALWLNKTDFIDTAFNGDYEKIVWVIRFELLDDDFAEPQGQMELI